MHGDSTIYTDWYWRLYKYTADDTDTKVCEYVPTFTQGETVSVVDIGWSLR